MEYEYIEYDVIIVGAGPAGLSAAIKLQQHAKAANKTLKVCILEKGAQVGAHSVSGAALDPKSLKLLLPNDWQNAPLNTKATADRFYYLTKNHAFRLPLPKIMKNPGNYLIYLSEFTRFLAKNAEALGCEIYPSVAAVKLLYKNNQKNQVIGVATGDLGIDKNGVKTARFEPGMHLHAKYVLLAEGSRGQLSEEIIKHFNLRANSQMQTYGLGVKEIWKIKPENHKLGLVMHTFGWPLNNKIYGGSFVYHMENNQLSLGFVVGLDYKNTWLSPFEEMQRFKTHPKIKELLLGGERIGYGARALNEGGWHALPKLTFPGGALIGDSASFLNIARIKGIHTAMYSGMLAADACFDALTKLNPPYEINNYTQAINNSWLQKELYRVRNIRPAFRYGLFFGLANAVFEIYIGRGYSPWTLKNSVDNLELNTAKNSKPIKYPKPDGKLTFDRLSSVYLTNTYHEENQPCHLKLVDPEKAITINYDIYASPETRYCPAAVYEIISKNNKPSLQINAQNCIHCKTCDIKDPTQNILWTAPEGGGGPNYTQM